MNDKKIDNFILKCFKILLNNSKVDLDGGNCGQVAYAIYKIVFLKFDVHLEIGIITNAEEHDEMIFGEPDIYHIFLINNYRFFDETGLIDKQYLLDLAEDQYDNLNPILFTLEMPTEESDLLKIISANTNYDTHWSYFYNLIMEKIR
jgi:hypothetical protein